jgi:hypothetical protein
MREKRTSASNGLGGTFTSWGFRNKIPSWSVPLARHPGPEKPRFWACQKVAPPPCKNVQKSAFLGEKACIFDHFVHNFAQKWPLFYGHSPPLQGCQSVGKKPANLYSTKCRIFGPRTPPPVAPWWDTSSRRPRTGSRRPFWQKRKNTFFQNTMMEIGCLLWHFFYII